MGCLADKVTLSPVQKKHYESVRWLFNEMFYRRQGRSYLMAVTVLEHALENPGNSIKLRDHCPPCDRFFVDTVRTVANTCGVAHLIVFLNGGSAITSLPCKYCGVGWGLHINGKCLFEASRFKSDPPQQTA